MRAILIIIDRVGHDRQFASHVVRSRCCEFSVADRSSRLDWPNWSRSL